MSTTSHPTSTGRMVWIFTRRHQHLEIRREIVRDGVELIVTGGDAPGTMLFRDLTAAVAHQSRVEARLLDAGWSLTSFEPERRSHEERRREARDTLDRRRWWTDPVFRANREASTALDGLVVRAESVNDYPAIRAVNVAAFGRTDEADLVERLREQGAVLAAFVCEIERAVVGHVLFSRAVIETATGPRPVTALAPLAVMPAWQRRGIGAALVRHGVEWLRAHEEQAVVVLGDAHYYVRFGFSADAARGVDSPFPPGALMAQALVPEALTGLRGRIRYADAFGL